MNLVPHSPLLVQFPSSFDVFFEDSAEVRLVTYTQFLIFAILTTVAIAACQNPPDAPPTSSNQTDCRTIQHELGETEICGQPQRIAVLGSFILEPLLALGIQPIAFADHVTWHQGNYDNPSQQIPYLGEYVTRPLINIGSSTQPSIEALVKLKPDLILGVEFNNADQYKTLSAIAPTVLLKWDDVETNTRAIAQAVGHPEKAEPLLAEMRQKIAAATKEFAPFVTEYPNVLLLSSSQLQEVYVGNTAHGLCSSLLTDLGFNLVSPKGLRENQPGAPVPVSLETLAQVEGVDLIILLGSDSSKLENPDNFREQQLLGLKQAWEKNAIAQSLNASKAGRVYFIPAYLCLGLPGPIGTELYLNELREQLFPSK